VYTTDLSVPIVYKSTLDLYLRTGFTTYLINISVYHMTASTYSDL